MLKRIVVFFSSKTRLEDGYIVEDNAVKECDNNLRKHIVYGDEIKLKGIHNFENMCAAIAATKDFVKEEVIIKALKEFKAVEHRLEFVKEIGGVKWYNDSASSSPTRTIAGIEAFPNDEIILIAGGYDKNLDYTPIAKPIVKNVKSLILLGQTSKKIKTAVEKEQGNKKKVKIYECKSLEETIDKAKEIATSGQVVLFSPASASFDMFKNAYERGNKFKQLVKKI